MLVGNLTPYFKLFKDLLKNIPSNLSNLNIIILLTKLFVCFIYFIFYILLILFLCLSCYNYISSYFLSYINSILP